MLSSSQHLAPGHAARGTICCTFGDGRDGVAALAGTQNPLREGLRLERTPEPCVMVIFGASGDLTKRRLIPALYNLSREHLIPPGFSVVGFARRDLGDERFRQNLLEGVNHFSRSRPAQPGIWDTFGAGISYLQGDFDDADAYRRLA